MVLRRTVPLVGYLISFIIQKVEKTQTAKSNLPSLRWERILSILLIGIKHAKPGNFFVIHLLNAFTTNSNPSSAANFIYITKILGNINLPLSPQTIILYGSLLRDLKTKDLKFQLLLTTTSLFNKALTDTQKADTIANTYETQFQENPISEPEITATVNSTIIQFITNTPDSDPIATTPSAIIDYIKSTHIKSAW
ncbi:hypothetical protein CEXT_496631 [Caerostris extrusa]|uniref:Uncharacterized protein n=1 Tax=Caerostris extrusa TaxID=172846 RepID=A0AAV4RBN3_CAEEX|nr:hypothetical protein CEXT_496631 [Caerostris extrusa]